MILIFFWLSCFYLSLGIIFKINLTNYRKGFWGFGVLGFWGLVFGESLGLVVSGVISGEVLGFCVRVAIGRQVASVNRRGCLGSRRVRPSSHLWIPNAESER